MKKVLSCLLAIVMVLSMIPMTVSATGEQETGGTNNEVVNDSGAITLEPGDDLQSLINAIPEGGSGEFTVQDTQWYLEFGLRVENRDITLNLVNAQMGTYTFENGTSEPLITGTGANITLNLDENSFIETHGPTGDKGVVRIENNTEWNEETQKFAETFTLTVNGGRYECDQGENENLASIFVAVPGTKIMLTDVLGKGTVKETDKAEEVVYVPGELVINSGKFTSDVSEYIADGHYCCEYADYYGGSESYYYVREKEMTDEFSGVLTDGKVTLNYDKAVAQSDAAWLLNEDFSVANPGFCLNYSKFNEDFSKVEIALNVGSINEERHTVDVVWNYDENVSEAAQEFIEKFPTDDCPWFLLTDMELVNYWAYYNPDSEIDSLANYSGELKNILGNSNFLYLIENRGGSDEPFYTTRIGSAKLMHNNIVYFASDIVGARAQHAIYVPESTGETTEELIAAAQKRIDDYIGEGVAEITYADSTVTEYYNSEIAKYDAELSTVQTQLQEARDTLAAEKEKPEENWDYSVISDCEWTIMQNENREQELNDHKNYFVECFEEGGVYYFLKSAAGDYFFDIEVLRTGEVFKFVIIKDDTKLELPSYASVDLDTKVAVETGESAVPLDTIINVDKLTQGVDYDRIMEVLENIENEMFDIRLHSGSLNKFFTKLENGEFQVKIPVPQKFSGKNLAVYYINANNEPVEYEVTVKDGFAVFATDHFSIYTLAEKFEHTCSGGTATCTSKAVCTICNNEYGEVNKDNHSGLKTLEAVAPDCTNTGLTEGEKCIDCGETTVAQTVVKALGHTTSVINAKSATCTADGYTGDTYCSTCKSIVTAGSVIKATGHKTSTINAKSATCTADGYTGDTYCSTCKSTVTAGSVIKAKGHTTSVINAKSATCTADGYTGDTYCSTCKSTTATGSVIKATGHKTSTINAKSATCTADGYTGDTYCSTCKSTVAKGSAIKATGHKTTLVGKKDATTKESGYTGDQVCSVCNEVIEKGTVIPKIIVSLATPKVTRKNTAKGIEVSWNAIEDAENYIVYRSVYNTKTKKWSKWSALKKGVTETSYVDGTVLLGTTYKYTVRAVNGDVMSKYVGTDGLKYNVKPTVKISNVATGVKVTWSTAANATGYTVYRSTYSNGKWSGWKNMGTAKANKTAWTDKNVKSGVQYKYTVRACYNKIKSSYKGSNVTIFLTQPTVKFANASTGIKVSWSKVSGATGYTVYRSQLVDGKWSNWKSMGTAKSTKSSWTDKKVESGATYKYTVRAVSGKYKSSYTDTKGLLYLAQPTVTVKAVSNGINVAWSQCEGATGYTVYRSEYNTKTKKWSSWKSMGTAKADKSNWTDKKATKGVKYKYTVRAVNADTGSKSTYVASKEVKR